MGNCIVSYVTQTNVIWTHNSPGQRLDIQQIMEALDHYMKNILMSTKITPNLYLASVSSTLVQIM